MIDRNAGIAVAAAFLVAACGGAEHDARDAGGDVTGSATRDVAEGNTQAATGEAAEGVAPDVEFTVTEVTAGVYMLQGAGGNVGLLVGDEDAVLIDDDFAPTGDKLLPAIAGITDRPLRYVLNTHWHFDHVGNNERVAQAGAVVVAHRNVRQRMSTEQFVAALDRSFEPSPPEALPIVTFADGVNLHAGGNEVRVQHLRSAHTDGDAIVHLPEANVIHAGDVYWNGFYPLIDLSSGGSIDGMLRAVDYMLELADDRTRIIPGHGPLSDREELLAYRAMLAKVRERVLAMLEIRLPKAAALNTTALDEFNAEWGDGFIAPDQFLSIVYDDLAAK